LSLNLGLRYEYTSTPYGWTQQTLNSIADDAPLITFGSPQAPKNNWMPRIGFAYSPGTSGNTSIRGGFGIAYDVLYDNIGVLERPPQIGSTVDCPDPACGTGGVGGNGGFLAQGGIPPLGLSGITVLDQPTARAFTSAQLPNHVKYPYAESWNLGVQRRFGQNYTAEVRYVGSRGIDMNTQTRLNIVSPLSSSNALPTFINCDATCQGTQPDTTRTLAAIQAIGHNDPEYLAATCSDGSSCPFLSPITSYRPYGSSTYHGLQTQLDRRFANGLYIQGAYTWSHSIDNSTADFFSTVIAPRRPQDFRNLPAERASSLLDHRNRVTLSLVYDTQWFKHSSSWVARNLLSGYEIAPTYIYETGQLATVQSGIDSNLNGDNAGDRVIINPAGRPGTGSDVLPIHDVSGDVVGYYAVDPTAYFIKTGAGALADAGRNLLTSPSINNWDLTIAKSVKFKERYELKFQFQSLNMLNHPQFTTGAINTANSISEAGTTQRNVLIPNQGDLDSGVFGNWKSAFSSNSRIVQLGAKFIF